MKKYKKMSAEERSAKIEALLTTIQDGVNEFTNSEKYVKLLKHLSAFHQYSPRNTILILMQCPNATRIASYNKWKDEFNRIVCRGEKAIKILCPNIVKRRHTTDSYVTEELEEDEYDTLLTGFSVGNVFDISQTEQIEGKEEIRFSICERLTGSVDGYNQIVEAVAAITDAEVVFTEIDGPECGYYSPSENRIVVQSEMSEKQKIKTLLHETAHALLHNPEAKKERKWSQNDAELEAESTAFVVADFLGIDTSDYTFPYLTSWSEKDNNLIDHLKYIKSASQKMIDELEMTLA